VVVFFKIPFTDTWLVMTLQDNQTRELDRASDRPVFILRLRPLKGVDAVRGLRWILKTVLRQFGFQAISCEEERVVD
jgi:hypothetical protein